jgi:hypothetical protein
LIDYLMIDVVMIYLLVPMTHQECLPAHQLIMAAQPSAEHHTLQPVDVNQQGVRAAAHVTRAS